MKISKSFVGVALVCALGLLPGICGAQATPPAESNLLSWGAGALVTQAPPSYSDTGNWAPESLLDELPDTGWANRAGDLTPKVFVFELAAKSEISSLEFDTAHVESAGRAAKNVKVEIADHQDGPYSLIATPSLAEAQDHQKFALKTPATGRYLKLTILNNWGDTKYVEMMNVFAYGKPLAKPLLKDNSGTFSSSYGNFHMQQMGSAVNGCYEWNSGLIENGGFDGRVLRFTWTEVRSGKRTGGPAILVFSDDGQSFTGYWWWSDKGGPPSGRWSGKRISSDVGSCPYWKPGTNSVEQQLSSEGRARPYGILFDTDSDRLKAESKPTLDALIAAARAQPTWKFGIEGYTDNVGGAAHNQTLSEKRALAVKVYLVAAGVGAARLTTQGFGSSNPVSSNATELGRSQNRRVEIVKR